MSGFRFRESMGPGLDYLGMAAKLGATCLRKPFSPRQLMAAINAGLGPALPHDAAGGIQEPGQGSKLCR
jgi:hypothetical protein